MSMKPVLAAAAAVCVVMAVGCKSQAQRDVDAGPPREGPPRGGGGGAGAMVDPHLPVDLATAPTLQLTHRS